MKESEMATKRKIEVFSAGCGACEETLAAVNRSACPLPGVWLICPAQAVANFEGY